MKKALCFILALILLLSIAACGQGPEPAATPGTETREPEADRLERALAYLHGRKGTFTQRHLYTYLELYRMTHPGANLMLNGLDSDNKQVYLDMTGLDVKAFAESGFLPDFVTVRSYGFANEFVPLSEPIPREPEWDRVSEHGVRFTMDRAVWPVGTEYVRFTLRNEGEKNYSYGADVQMEKYVAGSWQPLQHSGGIALIAYNLPLGQEVSLSPPMMYFPALGEGLYRVGFISKGDWAEFAVRREAEPLDLTGVWRTNYPEAALLLAGLPETVESELSGAANWPALSSTWELTAENQWSDRELADLLLGEEAEYDASAGVYRLGDCTLSLKNGAQLTRDTLLVKALCLTMGDMSLSLEQMGWKNGFKTNHIQPLSGLYPWARGTAYSPDLDILNARLAAALEALGEEAGELQGFRFSKKDLKDLQLLVIPVCTEADGPYSIPVCSPDGELAGAAAWGICRSINYIDPELLALNIRLPGYRLTPGETRSKTLSPLEQAKKFLPLLQEEGIRLVSFDYVLIPDLNGSEETTLRPAYRLLAETASGEERCFVVSAVSKAASAYDLPRRVWLEELYASGKEESGSFALNSIPDAETERLIRQCTHIVKAEYAGTESWNRGEMLAFIPLETWKGEIRDERIFLQAEDPVLLGRQGFKKGDTVILLLNRHISVYYPHDIYTTAGGYELGALEKARVDSLLADAPPPEKDHYGVEYTLSQEVNEILEATECIFTVEPISVSVPEGKGTVTWNCRVQAALRGQPVVREIHIVFFPGDVVEGEEYLVLLNNVDGGTLYVLSSRNSVYPLKEAQGMEEFAALLALTGEVTASETPTLEELLAAEQAAGNG